MTVEDQIEAYVAALPDGRRDDMRTLHRAVLGVSPDCRLWFLDGRNEAGKVVSNPNIGYGEQTLRAAGGKTRLFYRVGLSANTSGVSIYVMGLDDKTVLARTFGARLGKAGVTGYCIKFRSLKDVDLGVLEEVFRFGLADRT